MALDIQYPLINGVRHSWSSVEIEIGGLKFGGFTEVNYSAKLDGVYVRGQGSTPIAQTTGLGEFSADVTYLLAEMDQFLATLQNGFMTASFNMIVQYTNEGYLDTSMPVITDTISGCRITELSAAASNGSGDPLVRKATLKPMGMLFNGINPMPGQTSLSLGRLAGSATGIIRRVAGF